jgi:hypothetical protein
LFGPIRPRICADNAAEPSATFDANWGQFVIIPDFFTRLVTTACDIPCRFLTRLSNGTALALVFKPVEAAQKNWRRLAMGLRLSPSRPTISSQPPPDRLGRHQKSAVAPVSLQK